MSCKEILVFVALFAIAAAAVKQEPRHPPNYNHHSHGHHGHHPVPAGLLDPEVALINMTPEQPLPEQDEIVEEDGNEDVERQEDFKDVIDEEVSEDSGKSLDTRQEETEDKEDTIDELRNRALWVDCDYNVIPRDSCQDCRTRVLCKYPGGGKLVNCKNPLKPYCNNGYCSAVPSNGCA